MNFLALAKRLRQECGATGTDNTVVNATGEWSRLVNWIITAWEDIQNDQPNWLWMRKDFTFNTTPNKGEYSVVTDLGITDFAEWRKGSFRLYLSDAGIGNELLIPYRNYEAFRDYYLLASRRLLSSRPTEITVSPTQSLILGLMPDNVYVVSGQYQKNSVLLAADTDTPDLPSRFHMVIVYRAMMSYGGFDAANEVYARGEKEYKKMMNELELSQLPSITRGGSLM